MQISEIALDLKIQKDEKESENQFLCRVLYSAMACWIKYISLDRPVSDIDGIGTSKKHIEEKSAYILENILKIFPSAKEWFDPISPAEKSPTRIIRSRLIQNGDLESIGFNTLLTLAKNKDIPIENRISQTTGILLPESRPFFYSGISVLSITSQLNQKDAEKNSKEWLKDYCENSLWEDEKPANGIFEYFIPEVKRESEFLWKDSRLKTENITSEIRLLRYKTFNNACYYYLEKQTMYGTVKYQKLSEFDESLGQHIRIEYALRQAAGTAPEAKITEYKKHISVNLPFDELPLDILSFFESYAWPCNNISDIRNWILPACLLETVRDKLLKLGFALKFVQNLS